MVFTPTATLAGATDSGSFVNKYLCFSYTGGSEGRFARVVVNRYKMDAVKGTCADHGFKYPLSCRKHFGGEIVTYVTQEDKAYGTGCTKAFMDNWAKHNPTLFAIWAHNDPTPYLEL